MSHEATFVVFHLDGQRYALPFATVVRAVHAVEVTPLPNAPAIVLGVVSVAGRLVPVVDIRRRFGLPERAIEWTDHIVIARTSKRTVGLVVDTTEGIVKTDAERVVHGESVLAHLDCVQGVLKLDDGLVIIHDLEHFLSLDEEQALTGALQESV